MDPAGLVIGPTLALLGCIAVGVWAFVRDRAVSTATYRRLVTIMDQNQALRTYQTELITWGSYSAAPIPRTPPAPPLILDQGGGEFDA